MPNGFPFTTTSSSVALKRVLGALIGGTFALGATWVPNRAEALLVFTVRQVGTDVVIYGNGSINTQGLTFDSGPFDNPTRINSSLGELGTGPGGTGTPTDAYSGITGPENFGTGSGFNLGLSTDSASNAVYLCINTSNCNGQFIYLPSTYLSGNSISSTTIFSSSTLASLGLVPKSSFEWTWGAGAPSQTLRLDIEPVPAPLPLFGAASAYGWSRRLRRRIRNRVAVAPGSTTNS